MIFLKRILCLTLLITASATEKFGTRRSEDSEGTLETYAHVEIDVDYPGEKWYSRIYGVNIEAYAKVHADSGWYHEGEYSIDVMAEETPRRKLTINGQCGRVNL